MVTGVMNFSLACTWYYCSDKFYSVILKDKMSIIRTRGSAGDLYINRYK